MSREIALQNAVAYMTVKDCTVLDVIAVAEAFAKFLSAGTAVSETAAPEASKPKRAKAVKEDPAPSAPLTAQPEPVVDAQPEPAPVPAAAPTASTVTQEMLKTVIGQAASNPKVGPMVVRAVLSKCVNPDTKKAAVNVSTLHASHYAVVVAELTAAIAAAKLAEQQANAA